jgi:hypothetical protein
VEKPVENVENCEFSTAIWHWQKSASGCGKVCIPVCIKQVTNGLQMCYVTACRCPTFSESGRKSYVLVENRCQMPSPNLCEPEFFVKIRQNFLWYLFVRPGNTFPVQLTTEETACREK